MKPKVFESVTDMLSVENLSLILGKKINQVERDNFENEGFSGNNLEKLHLTTAEGKHIDLVLKHFDIENDWIMRLTHDDKNREVALYRAGLYQQLPPECIVPTIAVAKEGNSWASLMLDVSQMLVPSGDSAVPSNEIEIHIKHLAMLHAQYMGNDSLNHAKYGLCSEQDWIFMLSPKVGQAEVDAGTANDVSRNLVFAWDSYFEQAPDQATDILKGLFENPQPLLNALSDGPRTLLQGDAKYANIGSCVNCEVLEEHGMTLKPTDSATRTILIDWGLALYSSPFIELGWFLAINSAKLSISKEEIIGSYRKSMADLGHEFEENVWQKYLSLGLLAGGAVRLIWAKAMGAMSDDLVVKQRETTEVEWWSAKVIDAGKWLK